MCKVTVIVPVYNSEKYLRTCLDTLAAQTLDDIEIVIVNDGSTDGSLAIAEEFAARYSWFNVYSTENMGVSHARNYGVELSHGDYLAFVDSDDGVEPDYCKVMYEKAVKDGNDLVVCQFDRVTMSNGQIKHVVLPNTLFEVDNFRMAAQRELFANISVGPWDKLVRRDLFERLCFPEGIHYAEDQIFAVKAFCLAQNIGTVKNILYHYYYEIHGGITSSFGEERLDWLAVMAQLYNFMRSDEIGGVFDAELEYFIVAKCIRLCSAVVVRTDLPYELRVRIVRGIHAFLNDKLPGWRRNPHYISEVKKRAHRFRPPHYNYSKGKQVRPPYCNYSEGHLLFLIILSRLFPGGLFDIVQATDQVLFFVCRWIRWELLSIS